MDDGVLQTEEIAQCCHKTNFQSKLTHCIQFSFQQLQNQDKVFACLSEVFIWMSSNCGKPQRNGLTINNLIVTVTVIASDTEQQRNKESK